MTKLEATLAGDGRSFEEIGAARSNSKIRLSIDRSKPAAGQSHAERAADHKAAIALAATERRAARSLRVRRAAMADRKNSRPSDYVVGYRRPPKATQFTAGKSGNPKGRPKGAGPSGRSCRTSFRQKIAVTENGKTRRIPALEVMLRRLVNDAMRSDPSALKLLLSLIDRYAESPEADTSSRRAPG